MNIEIKYPDYSEHGAIGSIVEIEIKSWDGGSVISEDVSDFIGFVDDEFIAKLRATADELDLHNKKLEDKFKERK